MSAKRTYLPGMSQRAHFDDPIVYQRFGDFAIFMIFYPE